jgi:hypothetical protein
MILKVITYKESKGMDTKILQKLEACFCQELDLAGCDLATRGAFISYRVTFGPSVSLFTISNIGLSIPVFTAGYIPQAPNFMLGVFTNLAPQFIGGLLPAGNGLYSYRLPNKN